MKYPKIRDYPSQIYVGRNTWNVRFVKSIPGGESDWVGYCSESERTIYIVSGQGRAKTYMTWWHEIMHCFEYEYKISIPHKTIYELEAPIAHLILGNLYFS
jgi:hypothetical protein